MAASIEKGKITFPQVMPDTSFLGRLLKRRKTVFHTVQWSAVDEVAIGLNQLNACLYCERVNPPERYQCDGCGASLHRKERPSHA